MSKPGLKLSSEAVVRRTAEWLAERQRESGARLVGISGAQGSGKTTLTERLTLELRRRQLPTACLSLDDFYLPRADRARLAKEIHPLFATRGVPKTHDMARLRDALMALSSGQGAVVPVFDKATDDRLPAEQWRPIPPAPYRFVLLEGWCLGVPPQTDAELEEPINELEAQEDSEGRWRRAVNDALAGEYRALFAKLDLLIVLLAPSFDVVFRWRAEQEVELVRSAPGPATMSRSELDGFIRHFERLTRHSLEVLPSRADLVVELDPLRSVTGFVEG